MNKTVPTFIATYLTILSPLSEAGEVRIGDAYNKNGMEIAAVYLQPVLMTPMLPGMNKETDIHLEADIHALEGNQNGFATGDWIPYLAVTYNITKTGSTWSTTGAFTPMIASDGAHYGKNIKLDGAGKYHLSYHIEPPAYQGFYRHTDKETGVAKWWSPMDLEWDFAFVGTGKKGGY